MSCQTRYGCSVATSAATTPVRTDDRCVPMASASRRGNAAAAATRRSAPRGIRSAMPPTTPERYAVVSCHVERPLDDRVWAAFASLQERRHGGLAIAALLRPPDAAAGESD